MLKITCFLAAVLGSLGAWAESPNTKPIRIITNDWTSQIVLAHIAGELFLHQGYRVEYSSLTTAEQWGAMALGIDHVQVEVWQGTMADMFERMVAEGRIVDAGSHSAVTREEWWYPEYVEDVCPGLPDWRALRDCAALFAPAPGQPGRYVAGPWEKPEAARIRALGMNFRVDPVKRADDLWLELERAAAKKQPIVLFNWTPNWVEDRYRGKFVEFPAYSPECETDPSWGVNPDFHHDCGNPANGWLKKAAWSGMAKTWPCAYEVLEAMDFDNATIAKLAARVDVDGLDYAEVARQWVAENKALWQRWLGASCKVGD